LNLCALFSLAALSNETDVDGSQPWWLNVKVKLKLSHIYKTKRMLEAYVEVMYPIIHESLTIDSMHQKVLFLASLCPEYILGVHACIWLDLLHK